MRGPRTWKAARKTQTQTAQILKENPPRRAGLRSLGPKGETITSLLRTLSVGESLFVEPTEPLLSKEALWAWRYYRQNTLRRVAHRDRMVIALRAIDGGILCVRMPDATAKKEAV